MNVTVHAMAFALNSFVTYRLLPAGIYILIGLTLEKIARPKAQSTEDSRAINYASTLLFHLFDFTVGTLVVIGIASLLNQVPNRPLLLKSHPGFGFALLVAVCISISGDFGEYWWHRWQHSSKWLWPIHELHHSDECMNVTTTYRFHWLESPPRLLLGVIPGLLFPNPTVTLPLAYLLGCANVFFVHANANIGFGWFNRVIASPQTHRIHHSRLPQHVDKNFASVWPFWDILFGTYVHPTKGEHPPTGLASGETVDSVRKAAFLPFIRWREILNSQPERSPQGQ